MRGGFVPPRKPGDDVIVRVRTGGPKGHWIRATIKEVHEDRSVTICPSKQYAKLGYPDHYASLDVRGYAGPVKSSARRY